MFITRKKNVNFCYNYCIIYTTPHEEVIIRHMVKGKYAEYDQDFAKRDREMALASNLLKKVQARNRGSVRFRPLTRKNYNPVNDIAGSY